MIKEMTNLHDVETEKITSLKEQIDYMRQINCNKLADSLIDDLLLLLGQKETSKESE
jgi:hypothetical protein